MISRERVEQIRKDEASWRRAGRGHSAHFEMIGELLAYIDQVEAGFTALLESCLEEHLKSMPPIPIVRGRVADE